MPINHNTVIAAALGETLQNFVGTDALSADARHTLFTDFLQKLREVGAEAMMYDIIEGEMPKQPEAQWATGPDWEALSPREQAQWMMTEAADVMSPEEKDPYVLRAIAYLLMSVDDRLGAMQGPPATEVHNAAPAEERYTCKDGTEWAIGDRARTPGGNIGVIEHITPGVAGTFVDLTTEPGHHIHIKIEALLPVHEELPGHVLDALAGAVEALRRGARVAYGPQDTDALLTQAAICQGVLEAHGFTERPADHPRRQSRGAHNSVIGVHDAAVALRLAAEALEYIAPKSGVGDSAMLRERAATCRRALISQEAPQ